MNVETQVRRKVPFSLLRTAQQMNRESGMIAEGTCWLLWENKLLSRSLWSQTDGSEENKKEFCFEFFSLVANFLTYLFKRMK